MPEQPCEKPVSRQELQREVEILQQLIQAILSEREKALELQRSEYHRRLDELNQAHARAEKAAAATVPIQVYDLFVKSMAEWKDQVNEELISMKAVSYANAKFFGIIVAIVTLVFGGVAMWISLHK